MKKISFTGKLRLAVNAIDRVVFIFAVFATVVAICLLKPTADPESMSDSIVSMSIVVSFACFNGLGAIMVPTMFMQRMKFFETLPVTAPEIRDTAFLNVLAAHIILTVPQLIAAVLVKPAMMPYMICSQCVQLMLIAVLIMPIYFTDKNMYTPPAAVIEDERRKAAAVKGVVIGIGFMVLTGIDYVLILYRGLCAADSADNTALALISAAAVVIAAISAILCRNIKAGK